MPSDTESALQHFGGIRCEGKDALSFLHSQLSAPLNSLPVNAARLAALCRNDGRTLATLLVWHRPDSVMLVTRSSLVDEVRSHLQRYVLRADVTLAVAEPLLTGHQQQPENQQYVEWPLPPARWLTAEGPRGAEPDSRDEESPADRWIGADIRAGLAWLEPRTSGKFLPQELGLDQVGAVVYDRRCYPGQEIVARVHYLGRVKQQLTLAGCSQKLSAGARVTNEADKTVGTVLNSAPDPDSQGGNLIQLVIRSDNADDSGLQVDGAALLVSHSDSN